MKCKYCEKEIREGLIYCPFCGCRVAAEKRAPEPERRENVYKNVDDRPGRRDGGSGVEWKRPRAGGIFVQALIVGAIALAICIPFSFQAVGIAFKSTLVGASFVYAVLVAVLMSQIGGMTPSTTGGKLGMIVGCGLGIALCIFLAVMVCGSSIGQERNFDSPLLYIYIAIPAAAWLLWTITHWSGICGLWRKGASGKLRVMGIILLTILVLPLGAVALYMLLVDLL